METGALPLSGARGRGRQALAGLSDEDLVARVRAGDDRAFEVLYDRHHRGLLALARHLLGSVPEAEDALQHTMLSAYRAMRADDRPLRAKPWLYAIARNRCLSVLRGRRDERPLEDDAVRVDGLAAEVQRRAELRELVADLGRLPEDQRSALVLFELGDHPQDDIAAVLGVRREKVKALVFQARENLMAARRARETPCTEVRAQLATATGAALRRRALRRHVESCTGCAGYEAQVRRQRSALAVALPIVPAVGLKDAVLDGAGLAQVGTGAGAAAVGAEGALAKLAVAHGAPRADLSQWRAARDR